MKLKFTYDYKEFKAGKVYTFKQRAALEFLRMKVAFVYHEKFEKAIVK